MRLLIAEPDLHDCWSARLLLSHAGHMVVGAATTASMAASLARQTSPDLLLIDEGLAAGGDEEGAVTAEAIWAESGAPSLLLADGRLLAPFGPATLARLARPFGALELIEAVEICGALLRHESLPLRLDRWTRFTLAGARDAALQ